jgi:hypothetical protein
MPYLYMNRKTLIQCLDGLWQRLLAAAAFTCLCTAVLVRAACAASILVATAIGATISASVTSTLALLLLGFPLVPHGLADLMHPTCRHKPNNLHATRFSYLLNVYWLLGLAVQTPKGGSRYYQCYLNVKADMLSNDVKVAKGDGQIGQQGDIAKACAAEHVPLHDDWRVYRHSI